MVEMGRGSDRESLRVECGRARDASDGTLDGEEIVEREEMMMVVICGVRCFVDLRFLRRECMFTDDRVFVRGSRLIDVTGEGR